jgi:hypothetical protein
MIKEQQDYSEEYKIQLKKGRVWALYTVLIFLLIIIGLPVSFFAFKLDQIGILIYLGVCLLVMIPAIPKIIALSKCPSCKKFMGKNPQTFCPLCGVRIR